MKNHNLPELPYSQNALSPYISAETLQYHYGKHHVAYLEKLNKLIKGTEFESASLEDIIRNTAGDFFNNAAQVWNHNFYWNCLSPHNIGTPKNNLLDAISRDFENFNRFKDQFINAAISNFGSGWTWLVKQADGKLKIKNTSNANNPLTDRLTPLLTCDVWEHAYYIDYRNARANYLDAFWKLINWDFVESNFNKYQTD